MDSELDWKRSLKQLWDQVSKNIADSRLINSESNESTNENQSTTKENDNVLKY